MNENEIKILLFLHNHPDINNEEDIISSSRFVSIQLSDTRIALKSLLDRKYIVKIEKSNKKFYWKTNEKGNLKAIKLKPKVSFGETVKILINKYWILTGFIVLSIGYLGGILSPSFSEMAKLKFQEYNLLPKSEQKTTEKGKDTLIFDGTIYIKKK